MAPEAQRILVIRLGALGDLVQLFDTFHALRQHHAADRVILMTTPPFVGFARTMPWFDAIWTDTRPKWWRLGAWLRLRAILRAEPLTRVYDFQNKRRTAIYRRLLTRHIRPDHARPAHARPEWSGSAPGCSHPRPDPDREPILNNHDRYLAQIAAAGVPPAGPADLSWLDADVGPLGGLPERYVLLIPGCSPHLPHKRWPAARYAELIRRLAGHGLASVLIGTQADRAAIDAITAAAPDALDLCGRTSLAQLGTLARAAVGVIGNDTGPVFLTAAVGAPTLMLMSHHTDPRRSAPWGAAAHWLKRENLADLDVDTVMAALPWSAGLPPEHA